MQNFLSIMKEFGGNLPRALQDVFPKVRFYASKFNVLGSMPLLYISSLTSIVVFSLFLFLLIYPFPSFFSSYKLLGNHWRSVSNRKAFFDQYAKEHAFDPLIAENWYNTKTEDFSKRKVQKGERGESTLKIAKREEKRDSHSHRIIRWYSGTTAGV